MLTVNITSIGEIYDERVGFIQVTPQVLHLEHSLLSISKWESIHKKPFITNVKKTDKEALDYIACMVTHKFDANCLHYLTNKQINYIMDYINDPRSAVPVVATKTSTGNTITSEEIYAKMIANQVPLELEKWHFNRLINVLTLLSNPQKTNPQINKSEMISQMHDLNEERKLKLGTNG